MKKTVYLVEDEKNLNILLEKYLKVEGYDTKVFFDGESALSSIKENPDLWILDIMLPDIDGYEIIREIKKNDERTPVIFISAKNEELDRVVGLELGSDDYLSKPFLPRELIIRTNKILERVYKNSENSEVEYKIGDYKIDIHQRNVKLENRDIELTNNEFELLIYFIKNKNILISRSQILNNIWGTDYFGSDRVVDDTIRRLRKKISQINIETKYGYGYKLVCKE